ncbi:aminotransferase class V-fold PLP-dependent enzyme [Sulfitobacter sp. F26204]|uniref:cysteine desulfurase family protein n=1 Tax=Sulfitobacter sp. F26204 TaxID=2996014 RepID=UPI00225E107A|nr:aminotransferase class V-fold PLP-dependent enzyme [Sulfitobacter sp. F26204]MCX7559812.1 aminotransferase class V-fold PLP-dependent enzyme [Sulfitobacter sp. F26204]
MQRVYLDHNATTPLRSEARAAMSAAMDVVGNPSSVHAEGRAARMLVEKARLQVATLVGCLPAQVIFTSSATEAASLAVAQKGRHGGRFVALPTEHDCFTAWSEDEIPSLTDTNGRLNLNGATPLMDWLTRLDAPQGAQAALIAISAANSETGIRPEDGKVPGNGIGETLRIGSQGYGIVSDLTQIAGKAPIVFAEKKPSYGILSAHKMGGPKGIGAFINFTSEDPTPLLRGGGQEMNRRSGTENTIGIAGFGAAAQAAAQDVATGRWEEVAELRNILENTLATSEKKTIFVGKDVPRLPNTSCIIAQGWKGETQVMQMDLAGFAISAGSACSSGKVKASTVLLAMGFNEAEAASAIRVSLGLETTRTDVLRFAETWLAKREKHAQRAA